jgi:hypothetical protein
MARAHLVGRCILAAATCGSARRAVGRVRAAATSGIQVSCIPGAGPFEDRCLLLPVEELLEAEEIVQAERRDGTRGRIGVAYARAPR